jgi:hypothetical protein
VKRYPPDPREGGLATSLIGGFLYLGEMMVEIAELGEEEGVCLPSEQRVRGSSNRVE